MNPEFLKADYQSAAGYQPALHHENQFAVKPRLWGGQSCPQPAFSRHHRRDGIAPWQQKPSKRAACSHD
jgi:hypothetical protein